MEIIPDALKNWIYEWGQYLFPFMWIGGLLLANKIDELGGRYRKHKRRKGQQHESGN
jgi:hypothetical protein